MRLQNNFFDLGGDDTGVSPVVGVILMVAITVILDAVIGTFVLDLGGQVQQNAQAGVTFDENEGSEVTVQLNSVQSADHIFVTSSAGSAWTDEDGDTSTPTHGGGVAYVDGAGASNNPASTTGQQVFLLSGSNGGVGTTVTANTTNGAYATGETITVVGVLEGSESVIQTYTMGG